AVPPLLGTPGLPDPAPQGGVAYAWDDYGQTLGAAEGKPDVLASFYPAPRVTFPEERVDCSTSDPCASGEGDCDSNAECQPGLVCAIGVGSGPKHGFPLDVDICVPPHCADGVTDADELSIDCGGADCGKCLCGDGILFPLAGEACDDGNFNNNDRCR